MDWIPKATLRWHHTAVNLVGHRLHAGVTVRKADDVDREKPHDHARCPV